MKGTLLVTGGAGYVGSHCCRAFAQAGWRVVVFDNLSRGWSDFVRWGELIVGDLRDADAIRSAIDRARPQIVVHFAALAYVGESVAEPGLYYTNNVCGSLNLLDGMRSAGVGKIVFSSTCATYGMPVRIPMDEGHPQAPINPYGRSKLVVEQILSDYSRAYGIDHVALRYFNAAGADSSGELGERHRPETHVIPLALEAAMASGDFQIFGGGFHTRDGTAIRDYVHVNDLADAHLRAVDYLDGGGASAAFNLGTGVGTTVAEIAEAVERVSGRPLKRIVVEPRPGDPPALVAAAEKAREVLGWEPLHSNIDYIIRTAWTWHKQDWGR